MRTRSVLLSSPGLLLAQVDIEDYERVIDAGPWRARRGRSTTYVQRNVKIDGAWRIEQLHQFISGSAWVDHVDRNGLNNCRSNLRAATKSQNTVNSPNRNGGTSRYRGVSWMPSRGKWRSAIAADGKSYHLGLFDSELVAAWAYDDAARLRHGEFAQLNFPERNPS